jgi:hypothetical protein
VLAGLASLPACARSPMLEVRSAPFGKPGATLEERTRQIARAAGGLGWSIKPQAPGRLPVVGRSGGRTATLAILYDTERFSLQHVDSRGFRPRGGSVDLDYNVWVARLRDAIIAQSSI